MRKLLFILLSCISLNAYAHNCPGEFQPESGSCRIIGPDGRQIIYNSDPPQSGSSNAASAKKIIRHITVDVPSKYGALALNEKVGHIAGALNKDSKREAMQSAKIQCEQGTKGKPCKVITWVRNGCVAAAAGTLKGKAIITKAAEKPGKAEEVALNRCRASGAQTCEIIMPEGCSVPDGMYN